MNNRKTLLPKYSIIPIAFYLLVLPSYFLCRLATEGRFHFDASLPFDAKIPFVPIFILIYILAYLQWLVGYYTISLKSEPLCKKYFGAEILGKLICVLIFILVPTTINRPELNGSGITYALMNWMYSIDSPDNLFPSIHCMESWLVARGIMEIKAPKPAIVLMWIFSILVFMSVVFVKQHVFIDIFGGILVAELGIYLSRKLNMPGFFTAIEKKLHITK